jgi:hypothetical protein
VGEVRDHEQWRVAKLFAIIVDLLVGALQVLVVAFVLPGEVIAEPDICKAFAAVDLASCFSKA